ncbi:MAG: Flp pilus assembly protein CpaB [Betaproteobacteria bacterium]|nr:Flp pilus assembly protein CpaB [Betaproteobacteria bacterium]
MRNPRAIAMLVVSLLLGLLAAVLAANWLQQRAVAGNKVVVAAVDIQLGSRLNAQMLTTADWPAGSVPPGAFTDVKKLDGRVVKTTVLRGEPLVESKLAPVGTAGGLSAVIADGYRAITVRVNDVIGVAGFALPGNYVDIIVNTQDSSNLQHDRQISKIVLQHILVLAVAQETSRDETKPRVVNAVTLEVTPEQAEKIDLARNIGTLSLVLRNQMDTTKVRVPGVMKPELLNTAAESPPPPPARSVYVERHVVYRPRAPRAREPAQASRDGVDVVKNGISTLQCF